MRTNTFEYKHGGASGGSAADVELWRGYWILSRPCAERLALIDQAHAYWRTRGFPFQVTSREEAISQVQNLRRFIRGCSTDQLIESASTAGLSLANSYHPQMWSVRAYGRKRSPIDYFNDDDVLMRMLERAPRFWPNRSCWNAQCIRGLFRIAAPGRVANFRPMVAAGVVRKFCPPGGQVVDFCSGYGGRLLSAIACGARYFGIDAAKEQITGSRQMAADLRKVTSAAVVLTQGSAVEMLVDMESRSADLVFTSPPYFDKERYGDGILQSYLQFPSYTEWLEGFLRVAITQSFGVLKDGGFLVLNVANNRRFPLAADTRAIMNAVFGNVTAYQMRMRRLPSYNHFGATHRVEEILVSSKLSSKRRQSARYRQGPVA